MSKAALTSLANIMHAYQTGQINQQECYHLICNLHMSQGE